MHGRCMYTGSNRCFYLDQVRVKRIAQHSDDRESQLKLVFNKCVDWIYNAIKVQYHTTAIEFERDVSDNSKKFALIEWTQKPQRRKSANKKASIS